DIAALRIVPPAEEIHVDADFPQRCGGLFDLDLKSAVGQQERIGVVEQHAHGWLKVEKAPKVEQSISGRAPAAAADFDLAKSSAMRYPVADMQRVLSSHSLKILVAFLLLCVLHLWIY